MNGIKRYKNRFYRPKSTYDWLSLVLVILAIVDSLINAQFNGDFIGYLNSGYKVLDGQNIYFGHYITWSYFNTWPPFFSIVAVVVALGDMVSPYGVRFIWILGSWISLFYIVQLTVRLFFDKKLLLPLQEVNNDEEVKFAQAWIVIPLLLILRLMLDNTSHLQINAYMLALAVGAVYLAHKDKPILAGLLLGFSISIKVFTVFILFYFIFKRAYKVSIATGAFLLVFFFSTFLVYGQQSIFYHSYWIEKFVLAPPSTSQMNQGLLALLLRIFSSADTGIDIMINGLSWTTSAVKKLFYGIVLLGSIWPIYAFRHKLDITSKVSVSQALQWAILFCAIPILSPISWKYYFIFLWLPIFTFFFLVKKCELVRDSTRGLMTLFVSSMVLLIGSSELFCGVYFSDFLEVYGVITFGTILLLMSLILLYLRIPKAQLDRPLADLF